MNLNDKKNQTAEILEKFDRAKSIVLIDYRGLTVEQATDLRNKYRAADIDYKVYKNTLITRAIEGKNLDGLNEFLSGPTSVAISYNDEVSGPKVTSDFIKDNSHISIKCGVVNGEVIDVNQVKALAALPTKEVLLAKMLGSMNAPITNFVGVLAATMRGVVTVLDVIAKQKQEQA